MRKSITNFTGIVRTTPEHSPGEGACEELINLRYEDNNLRPVRKKKIIISNVWADSIYVHSIGLLKIFIIVTGKEVKRINADGTVKQLICSCLGEEIYITNTNNLLIINCLQEESMRVYNFVDNAYKTHFLSLPPALFISYTKSPRIQRSTPISTIGALDDVKEFEDLVFAMITEARRKSDLSSEGYMLVTANYTLMDNSETKMSPPILVKLGSYSTAQFENNTDTPEETLFNAKINCESLNIRIDIPTTAAAYKDIIKNCNIYCSSLISQYSFLKPDAKTSSTGYTRGEDPASVVIGRNRNTDSYSISGGVAYGRRPDVQGYQRVPISGSKDLDTSSVPNIMVRETEFRAELFDNLLFFKVKELPFKGASQNYNVNFSDIEGGKTMEVDSTGWVKTVGKPFVYNNRLHLFDIRRNLQVEPIIFKNMSPNSTGEGGGEGGDTPDNPTSQRQQVTYFGYSSMSKQGAYENRRRITLYRSTDGFYYTTLTGPIKAAGGWYCTYYGTSFDNSSFIWLNASIPALERSPLYFYGFSTATQLEAYQNYGLEQVYYLDLNTNVLYTTSTGSVLAEAGYYMTFYGPTFLESNFRFYNGYPTEAPVDPTEPPTEAPIVSKMIYGYHPTDRQLAFNSKWALAIEYWVLSGVIYVDQTKTEMAYKGWYITTLGNTWQESSYEYFYGKEPITEAPTVSPREPKTYYGFSNVSKIDAYNNAGEIAFMYYLENGILYTTSTGPQLAEKGWYVKLKGDTFINSEFQYHNGIEPDPITEAPPAPIVSVLSYGYSPYNRQYAYNESGLVSTFYTKLNVLYINSEATVPAPEGWYVLLKADTFINSLFKYYNGVESETTTKAPRQEIIFHGFSNVSKLEAFNNELSLAYYLESGEIYTTSTGAIKAQPGWYVTFRGISVNESTFKYYNGVEPTEAPITEAPISEAPYIPIALYGYHATDTQIAYIERWALGVSYLQKGNLLYSSEGVLAPEGYYITWVGPNWMDTTYKYFYGGDPLTTLPPETESLFMVIEHYGYGATLSEAFYSWNGGYLWLNIDRYYESEGGATAQDGYYITNSAATEYEATWMKLAQGYIIEIKK